MRKLLDNKGYHRVGYFVNNVRKLKISWYGYTMANNIAYYTFHAKGTLLSSWTLFTLMLEEPLN